MIGGPADDGRASLRRDLIRMMTAHIHIYIQYHASHRRSPASVPSPSARLPACARCCLFPCLFMHLTYRHTLYIAHACIPTVCTPHQRIHTPSAYHMISPRHTPRMPSSHTHPPHSHHARARPRSPRVGDGRRHALSLLLPVLVMPPYVVSYAHDLPVYRYSIHPLRPAPGSENARAAHMSTAENTNAHTRTCSPREPRSCPRRGWQRRTRRREEKRREAERREEGADTLGARGRNLGHGVRGSAPRG